MIVRTVCHKPGQSPLNPASPEQGRPRSWDRGTKARTVPPRPPLTAQFSTVFSRTLHNHAASRVAPDIAPGSEVPGPWADVGAPHKGSSSGSLGADWGNFIETPMLSDSTEELDNTTVGEGLRQATLLDWVALESLLSPGRVGLEMPGMERWLSWVPGWLRVRLVQGALEVL